jgi:hypothetical protein
MLNLPRLLAITYVSRYSCVYTLYADTNSRVPGSASDKHVKISAKRSAACQHAQQHSKDTALS